MSEKRITVGQMMEELAQRREEDKASLAELGARVCESLDLSSMDPATVDELRKLYLGEVQTETEQKEARHEMLYGIDYAANIINSIEKSARQHGIKITVHFGAELANTHDALTELKAQIRKL